MHPRPLSLCEGTCHVLGLEILNKLQYYMLFAMPLIGRMYIVCHEQQQVVSEFTRKYLLRQQAEA